MQNQKCQTLLLYPDGGGATTLSDPGLKFTEAAIALIAVSLQPQYPELDDDDEVTSFPVLL